MRWPLPRADELDGRDQSGEEDRRQEDTGEVRTENMPSEQYYSCTRNCLADPLHLSTESSGSSDSAQNLSVP